MRLIIIKFSDSARKVFDGTLAEDIPEDVWTHGGGGTEFGSPIHTFFESIDPIIDSLEAVDFYFFTDGWAYYPTKDLTRCMSLVEMN